MGLRVSLLIILAAAGLPAFAAGPPSNRVAVIDGHPVTLTCAIEKGQTLVWVRDIEGLGWGKVEKGPNGSVVLRGNSISMALKAGSNRVMVNNLAVTAPVAPRVVSGKLMAPLEFICSALGYSYRTNMEPVTRIGAGGVSAPRNTATRNAAGVGVPSASISYRSTLKLASAADPVQGDGSRIIGRVTFGGKPLPDVKLKLIKPDGGLLTPDRSVVTNQEGQFLFSDVPPGDYRVYAYVGDNPEYFNRASAPISLARGTEATVSDIAMGKALHPVSPGVGETIVPSYGRTKFICTACPPAAEYNFSITEASSNASVVSGSSDKPEVFLDISSLEIGRTYHWRVTAIDPAGDVLGGSPGAGSQSWSFVVAQRGMSTQAVDAAPAEKAQAIYDSACALKAQGKNAQAVAEWNKTLSKEFNQPDPRLQSVRAESLVQMGEAQRNEGDYDNAIASYNTALTEYRQIPGLHTESLLAMGKVYQAKNDFQKAYSYYKDVLKTHPEQRARGRQTMARIDEMISKGLTLSEAEKAELATIVKKFGEMSAHRDKVEADKEKAAKAGSAADLLSLANDPLVSSNVDQLNQISFALYAVGDRVNAQKTFDKCMAVSAKESMPEDISHMKTAWYHLNRQYDLAIAEATRSLRLYPQGRYMTEFRFWLADGYDYTNQLEKAVRTYDELADRCAGTSDFNERRYANTAVVRCGIILMDAGRKEEAIARFQRAIKDFPGTFFTNSAEERLKILQPSEGS